MSRKPSASQGEQDEPIQPDRGWVRLEQLTQAKLNSVQVRTVMCQGLGDRLFDQLGRIVLVQLMIYIEPTTEDLATRMEKAEVMNKVS